MKVKFNNGDFDFYRSGVMVLERLKKWNDAITESGLTNEQIDKVVLVGGSTKCQWLENIYKQHLVLN